MTNQQVQSEIGSSSWVLSIAKGKIRDSQPAANREAENLAEKNIRSQLKEQVSKVLQDAKANLESSLIDPLTKSGMRPQSVQFQTTNAWLILTANWGKSTTTTPPTFEPSADLVATMPETTFVKVYNSLTGEQVKTVSDLESKLTEFTLPKSWNQSAPLTLIKKETRDGNLILQWSRAK